MNKKIQINCKSADLLPMGVLEEFQGMLKNLSVKNRDRLYRSIQKQGFIAPIFVWKKNGKNKILDGHQRLKTLQWMRDKKGYTIPDLPVDYIYAETEQQAREKLLSIASQYGEFDTDELSNWVDQIDDEIKALYRFVNKEVDLNKGSGVYTMKIEAPIYEPSEEKPEIEDLYNTEKVNQLIEQIDNSSISDKEKNFLKVAAYRHTVFNYKAVANYYANSEKEVQELFENSALVIIDFNKALELGYLNLSKKILEAYQKDYGTE